MNRITEKEALDAIRAKGYITRFKGYYVNVYATQDGKTYNKIAALRSANGTLNAKQVAAL